MENYIANAFKSLDEVLGDVIEIDPPTPIGEREEKEPENIRDLFISSGSYITSHPFVYGGEEYNITVEALDQDGQSVEYSTDHFDESKIKDVLVDLVDVDWNFITTLSDISIDSLIPDVISTASEVIERWGVEEEGEEIFDDISDTTYDTIDEEITEQDITETEQLIDDLDKAEIDKEAELGIAPEEKDKELKEASVAEQQTTQGRTKFRKGHPLTLKGEGGSSKKDLEETFDFDLSSQEETKEAEKLLKENEESIDDEVTQIVDVDAETVEEVKAKSYIGNAIIQCPVCNTLHYKELDALVSGEEIDDEGNKIYNVGDTCSHCGSEDGYLLVGQVASLSVEAEQEPPAPAIPDGTEEPEVEEEQEVEPIEAPEVVEEPQIELPDGLTPADGEFVVEEEPKKEEEEEVKESLKTITPEDTSTIILETFDDKKFNYLARLHLQEVYKNIKGFTTTGGGVDDKGNIIVEGNINYKSGKERPTKFIFEKRAVSKTGVVRYVGVNETFSTTKAFTLTGRVKEKKFIGESLRYRYKIDGENLVEGRVSTPQKR